MERTELHPCPNCDKPLSKDAVLCVFCGFNLKKGAIEESLVEGVGSAEPSTGQIVTETDEDGNRTTTLSEDLSWEELKKNGGISEEARYSYIHARLGCLTDTKTETSFSPVGTHHRTETTYVVEQISERQYRDGDYFTEVWHEFGKERVKLLINSRRSVFRSKVIFLAPIYVLLAAVLFFGAKEGEEGFKIASLLLAYAGLFHIGLMYFKPSAKSSIDIIRRRQLLNFTSM